MKHIRNTCLHCFFLIGHHGSLILVFNERSIRPISLAFGASGKPERAFTAACQSSLILATSACWTSDLDRFFLALFNAKPLEEGPRPSCFSSSSSSKALAISSKVGAWEATSDSNAGADEAAPPGLPWKFEKEPGCTATWMESAGSFFKSSWLDWESIRFLRDKKRSACWSAKILRNWHQSCQKKLYWNTEWWSMIKTVVSDQW